MDYFCCCGEADLSDRIICCCGEADLSGRIIPNYLRCFWSRITPNLFRADYFLRFLLLRRIYFAPNLFLLLRRSRFVRPNYLLLWWSRYVRPNYSELSSMFLKQNYAEFILCRLFAVIFWSSCYIFEAELRRVYLLLWWSRFVRPNYWSRITPNLFAVVVKPICQAELFRIIFDVFGPELGRIYFVPIICCYLRRLFSVYFAPIFLKQNYAEFICCCGEADLSGRIIEAELRRIYLLLSAVVVKTIRQAELLRIILDIFEAELRRIYLLARWSRSVRPNYWSRITPNYLLLRRSRFVRPNYSELSSMFFDVFEAELRRIYFAPIIIFCNPMCRLPFFVTRTFTFFLFWSLGFILMKVSTRLSSEPWIYFVPIIIFFCEALDLFWWKFQHVYLRSLGFILCRLSFFL